MICIYCIIYTCISDENECLVDNGGCEHMCVNTNDGFFCTCEQGFTLESGKYCDGKLSDYIRYKINPYLHVHAQYVSHVTVQISVNPPYSKAPLTQGHSI